MSRGAWIRSVLLLAAVAGIGAGLAAWKHASMQASEAAAASQPEPAESVAVAAAKGIAHRPTTTSIGTVVALRSITLRNELAGTVRDVRFAPGQVVEAGTILVTLDVSVEEAELRAQEAQAAVAEALLRRVQRASERRAASAMEVDRARGDLDVARAQIARIEAIIARKTLRAPFRARVGLADVHPGQYLDEGTALTTLQGVDDAVHVDFTVPQPVAAGLRVGQAVAVLAASEGAPTTARIVALDARIDPATRNATVRARVDGAAVPRPGASVRVRVPVGPPEKAVAIPVSALRKGPGGDHVFVVGRAEDGRARARLRHVETGPVLGDEVVIRGGLAPGEQVAASGSFKLRDAALVAIASRPPAAPGRGPGPAGP